MAPCGSTMPQSLTVLTCLMALVLHLPRAERVPDRSFLQLSFARTQRRTFKVAVAVIIPYGTSNSTKWRDGFAVWALSAKKAADKSINNITVLGILPDTLPNQQEESRVLSLLGITPRFVPVPVPLDQIRNDFARKNLGKVLGEMEQLKYYGAAFTEFDRVVIMDGDTVFVQPIDELFPNFDKVKLKSIYDHELDYPSSTFPPINTGFLVFKPDKADFDAICNIVREGDYRDGTGWAGSKTGWTYGTGSQGILSFYYNQVQLGVPGYNPAPPQKGKDLPGMNFTVQPPSSRFLPLDRSVYDVIDTKLLRDAVREGRADASRVKIFHYTGGCPKPWLCATGTSPLCEEMTQRWWALRAELARASGASEKRCTTGDYQELPLLGYPGM
eukprot:TRINITY_DN43870_c0_g1_i1.p1 TRINITY_DN43870_c0_g1~~TRINITY_DN43870_c0_g1_i1.p1  ORF type:complete len:386 (+),score=61.11 TRINITY_DN43870_c0_g1_i1:119-1276(+)